MAGLGSLDLMEAILNASTTDSALERNESFEIYGGGFTFLEYNISLMDTIVGTFLEKYGLTYFIAMLIVLSFALSLVIIVVVFSISYIFGCEQNEEPQCEQLEEEDDNSQSECDSDECVECMEKKRDEDYWDEEASTGNIHVGTHPASGSLNNVRTAFSYENESYSREKDESADRKLRTDLMKSIETPDSKLGKPANTDDSRLGKELTNYEKNLQRGAEAEKILKMLGADERSKDEKPAREIKCQGGMDKCEQMNQQIQA